MNVPLYRWLVRRAAPTMASLILSLALYEWLLILIYPTIAKSHVSVVLQSLPKGLLSAFGLRGGHETLGVFLSSEFFGLIWVLVLVYFVASEASRLPAGMLERSQLTPILLTPASRGSIIVAAAAAVLTELLLVDALSLACAALLAALYGVSIAGLNFFLLGIGVFVLLGLLGAIGIAASTILPGERATLGVAAGLSFIFYVLDFAARISPRLFGLEHLTPFAAYRPVSLLAGHIPVLPVVLEAVFALGIILLAAALFSRRDLRSA